MTATPVLCSIYRKNFALVADDVELLAAFKWAREQRQHVVIIVRQRDGAILGAAGKKEIPNGAALRAWGIALRERQEKARQKVAA